MLLFVALSLQDSSLLCWDNVTTHIFLVDLDCDITDILKQAFKFYYFQN